ncbi:MAG: hypothetical protein IT302_07065 [Dehalococcoidia bacterium]|nr:hypothetical protein [Dehalococcoidia bacterium]
MRAFVRALAVPVTLAGVLAAGFVFAPPGDAHAQAGTCLPYFNGADITGNQSHNAHPIDGTKDLDLAIKAFGAVGLVTMKVEAGPWSKTFQPAPGGEREGYSWAGAIPPSQFAAGGGGIFRVTIESSGGCQSIAWINITGKSVFETTAGRLGLAGFVLGLAAVAVSMLLAWRRNFLGIFFAAFGGLLAGLALTVVAWQAGKAPLEPLSLLAWGLPPLLIGAGGYAMITARRGPARDDDDLDDDDDDFDAASDDDHGDPGVNAVDAARATAAARAEPSPPAPPPPDDAAEVYE